MVLKATSLSLSRPYSSYFLQAGISFCYNFPFNLKIAKRSVSTAWNLGHTLLHPSPLPNRPLTVHSRRFFKLKKVLHFQPRHQQDGVDPAYSLIYENSQGPLLAASRPISSIAGAVALVIPIWTVTSGWADMPDWKVYTLAGATVTCSLGAVVFVNVISRFYLHRIYHLEEKGDFVGVYHSLLGKTRRLEYNQDDIRPLPANKLAGSHTKCTVRIKDNSFHLRASDFILPKYYNAHLKYS